jgi:hypothetical protein
VHEIKCTPNRSLSENRPFCRGRRWRRGSEAGFLVATASPSAPTAQHTHTQPSQDRITAAPPRGGCVGVVAAEGTGGPNSPLGGPQARPEGQLHRGGHCPSATTLALRLSQAPSDSGLVVLLEAIECFAHYAKAGDRMRTPRGRGCEAGRAGSPGTRRCAVQTEGQGAPGTGQTHSAHCITPGTTSVLHWLITPLGGLVRRTQIACFTLGFTWEMVPA